MLDFIIAHFWTILGIVTGFGSVATVVILLVLGVPAALIVANVIGFFKAVVEFFKTPLGQLVFLVAVVALCCFVTDIHRRQVDLVDTKKQLVQRDREWQAKVDEAANKFKTARVTRDNSVDTDLQKLVDEKTQEIDALQNKVQTYEGPEHPGCVLTPADLAADGMQQKGIAAAGTPASPKPAPKRWFLPFRYGG